MYSDCHLPEELWVAPAVDLHVVLLIRSRFVLNSASESDQVEVFHISELFVCVANSFYVLRLRYPPHTTLLHCIHTALLQY